MHNWALTTLEEITDNFDSLRIPVKRADRNGGKYPYYGASGIIDYVDDYIFSGEYLLVAEDGENLKSRKTPIAFIANGKFWVNNHAHIIRANAKSNTRFLMYVLEGKDISPYITGTTVPKLNQDNLNSIQINLPPLPTQERIADILGTLDDKIELNRQMNRTLEAMARAIFKSWFVGFDPVTAKMEGRDYSLPAEVMDIFPDKLVESELGLIPKGWEVRPLDKIANYMNGYAMQKYPPKAGEDSIPVIKIRELRVGTTDNNSNRASLDIPEKYIIKDGDVLFSWSGSLLVTLWTGGKGALNQHLFKVTSKNYSKWFYYLWTYYHLSEFQRIAAGKATTMGHIKRNHLSQALTLVPDEKVMVEGNKVLNPIIEKIITNSLESGTLKKMRDMLLPRLMSGDLSL